ncbi:hypothetical protein BY458DRAFT_554447 [Sporodiniella umbellata]|nr:hypothetical protein BY458DRAFT_554447 [Sporodiniella umbellata]
MESSIYSLDIGQFHGLQTHYLNNKWNLVEAKNDFDPEKRRTPQFVPLPDGLSFLVIGGEYRGPGDQGFFTNQTILYNTSSHTWTSLPAYQETPPRPRQIFFGTAVNLPSATNDTVGLFGGNEDRVNTSVPVVSVTHQTVPFVRQSSTSPRGFDSMTVFNMTSKKWTYFSPQRDIPMDYYPSALTGTLNAQTGIIYYLGGNYYTSKSSYAFNLGLNQAHVFDTRRGQWGIAPLQASESGSIPSYRLYHTATLLPNSQILLLYGGSADGSLAVTDFMYTLNLTTNTWTERSDVNIPTYVAQNGARFGHSAVLVNTTLFILFGRDINGNPTPNLMAFDVANASSIDFRSVVPFLPLDPVPTQSLERGVQIGMIVGSVGVLLALGCLAYYFFRQRQKKKKKQEDQDVMVMHVDWDAIEHHYREDTPPTYYPAPFRQTPDVVFVQNKPHEVY